MTARVGIPHRGQKSRVVRLRVRLLPPEVHAKVLVESLVVGLKVLLQPSPDGRVHPLRVPPLVDSIAQFRGAGFPVGQVEEIQNELQDLPWPLEEVLALEHEHLLSVEELRPAQEMVHVDAVGEEPLVRTIEAGFHGLFERLDPVPVSRPMVIGGIGPVYRVPQQHYELRFRYDPGHPLCGVGVEQVAGGAISGNGSPPVLQPGGQETLAVPLCALLEEEVEEVHLFEGGGYDVRVLGQKVVEKGRSALRSPDDDEVGQRPQLDVHPELRAAKLVSQSEYLLLLLLGLLYLLEPLGLLRPALRGMKLLGYLGELPPLGSELFSLFGRASPGLRLLGVRRRAVGSLKRLRVPHHTKCSVESGAGQATLLF